MSQLGRSAGLTGFMEVAREAGLEPYRLAAAAGVPRAALTNPEMMVSISGMTSLIERAAEASRLEDFGLRMAKRRSLATMGPLGLAIRQQTTLRAALQVLIDFSWTANDALTFSLADDGEVSMFRIAQAPGRRRATTDLVLGTMFRVVQAIRGSGWRPMEVRLMHGPPVNLEAYRRFYGVAPRYEQDFTGMIIRRRELDEPIAGADPAMADEALRYLELIQGPRRQRLSQRVTDLLSAQLTNKAYSVDRLAEQMGIDRRTLHRRLANEGASYSELLTAVRRDLAQTLLGGSDRPLADIADALGFASLSVFAHWFRRNFGCTASTYRARHAGG